MVYKLLVVYLFVVAYFYQFIKTTTNVDWKNRNLFLIPAFIGLFFVMGFRSIFVGVDTYNYSVLFNSVAKLPLSIIISNYYTYDVEFGFVLFLKMISIFGGNYYLFQVVISFFFCFLMYRFIRDNMKDNYITGTFLFMSIGIYLLAFNITRQMLAVALVANAWSELKKTNSVMCILFGFMALSIHLSSIIAIFILSIYIIRDNRKLLLIVFILILIFPFIFFDLLPFVAKYLTSYGNYFSNTREIQEANMIKILWGIEGFMALYVIFLNKKFNSEDQFVAIMSLINVVSNVISLNFNYFERVGFYFYPFLILLFGILGNSIKDRFLNGIYYISINICFLLFFLRSASVEQYIYSFFF